MSLAERWVTCRAGHVHWGALGGAGFLFRVETAPGPPTYLLAQRSRSVDEGGTWGIPGGALRDGETPEQAARRELAEEIGVVPSYRVAGVDRRDCGGGWAFTVIHAVAEARFPTYTGSETDATGWFTAEQAAHLPLHSGLATIISDAESRPAGSD